MNNWDDSVEKREPYINHFENNPDPLMLDSGLWYIEHIPSIKSEHTDTYPVVILKIDPAYYTFDVQLSKFNGPQYDSDDHSGFPGEAWYQFTAGDWAEKAGMVATINAGMFMDGELPNGYTIYKGSVVQKHKPKGYSHYVSINQEGKLQVFDPACETVPDDLYSLPEPDQDAAM